MNRKRRHILLGGRVFIPLSRMRRIRWEEAVLRSRAKRGGRVAHIQHTTCHCGSMECQGAAIEVERP